MIQKILFADRDKLEAHALFLGEAIDLQATSNQFELVSPPEDRLVPPQENRLANLPQMVRIGEAGSALLFGYGAAVLFGLDSAAQTDFLDQLSPLVSDAFGFAESERAELHLNFTGAERVRDGYILLPEFSLERLQIVADVLAKTVVLAHYERSLAKVFDQMEPFAASLQHQNGTRRQGRELLRQLGSTLLVQNKIVGRVEIIDKPEVLWEAPELEHFYLRLETEYEIRERHLALERKLELVSRTAETVLEFMQHRTSLRVEWYIVILIVGELLLSLYDIFLNP